MLAFNRADYITLFLATSRIGAILVPLNFRLAMDEFIYYFQDASPKAFFFDQRHHPIAGGELQDAQGKGGPLCLLG